METRVVSAIKYKGREYWPPVFLSSETEITGSLAGDGAGRRKEVSLASFGKCILSHFGEAGDRTHVEVEFGVGSGLVLKRASSISSTPVVMEHSAYCPMRHIENEPGLHLNMEPPFPPVKVGVSVVIENKLTRRVLLTRRSATMRTFPHVWVVPGGHMEIGETLEATAIREVKEETGIQLAPKDISLLAVYESVFPVLLSSGKPSDHHIVVYMKALVDVQEPAMRLQVFEVDAAAWLSKEAVRSALFGAPDNSSDGSGNTGNGNAKTTADYAHSSSDAQTFEAYLVDIPNAIPTTESDDINVTTDANNNTTESTDVLRRVMYRVNRLRSFLAPDGTLPQERLSTGCRFALREWLALHEG